MVSSLSSHHDHRGIISAFKAKIECNVAPGIAIDDDPRSIAKGLTSKLKKLLSKICQEHVQAAGQEGSQCRQSHEEVQSVQHDYLSLTLQNRIMIDQPGRNSARVP
jgi:predicted metal-dependent TIM-barrel fold hydrolase